MLNSLIKFGGVIIGAPIAFAGSALEATGVLNFTGWQHQMKTFGKEMIDGSQHIVQQREERAALITVIEELPPEAAAQLTAVVNMTKLAAELQVKQEAVDATGAAHGAAVAAADAAEAAIESYRASHPARGVAEAKELLALTSAAANLRIASSAAAVASLETIAAYDDAVAAMVPAVVP